jgi:hypothetical protein
MELEPGFRVLVSGSRTWRDDAAIWCDLDQALAEATASGLRLVLVHGHCPRGADAHADAWGNQVEQDRNPPGIVIVERHPANWDMHGKKAGFIRNRVMVESGIDIALVYVHDDSKGALHTLGLARAAGLRRKVYRRWGEDWDTPVTTGEERPIPGLEGL